MIFSDYMLTRDEFLQQLSPAERERERESRLPRYYARPEWHALSTAEQDALIATAVDSIVRRNADEALRRQLMEAVRAAIVSCP